MNICGVYINGEITDKFFYNLSFFDKLNLTKCCKGSFKRYKDIVRHEAFRYINYDYKLFYECLRRFKYTKEEQKKLIEISMNVLSISTISGTFMDLRFIFEICYYLNGYLYKNMFSKHKKKNDKEYILQLMIKEIYKSISFNRYESIRNIEKEMILFSLMRNFKPTNWITREDNWTHIII